MFREFAVEPEAILRHESFSFWRDAFLNDTGRFISWDKDDWGRDFLVSMNSTQLGQMEQKKFILLLRKLTERAFIHRQIASKSNGPWCDRAFSEHQRQPFDGIVPAEGEEREKYPVICLRRLQEVIDFDDLPEDDVRRIWLSRGSSRFQRTSDGIAHILSVLLRNEPKLIFCDPYFDFSERSRYIRSFSSIFKEIEKSDLDPRNRVVELHSTQHNDICPEYWQQSIEDNLPRLIPSQLGVRFVLWPKKKHHNRRLLTNTVGVSVGEGFAESRRDSREFDEATLLPREDSLILIKELDTKGQENEVVADFEITGP